MSSNSANNKREIIFSAIIISVGMVLLSILPVLLNNAEKSKPLQERRNEDNKTIHSQYDILLCDKKEGVIVYITKTGEKYHTEICN